MTINKLIIETNRLILKPHTLSNTQSLYKIFGDVENMSFYLKPYSIKEIENLIKRSINLFNEQKRSLYLT